MRKTKVLVMTDGNFLAHATRVLEIGKILRDSYGYEVVFAGTGSFMKLPKAQGFATDHLFTMSGQVTLDLAKAAGLVNYTWWKNVAETCLESDCEVIERHRPDLILADMRWTAAPAARRYGIPFVSLLNAAWTNYYGQQIRPYDDHYLTQTLGEKIMAATMPFFRWLGVTYWGLPLAFWQFRHAPHKGLPRDLFNTIEGDLTLLCDIPEYFPTKNLPRNFHYVGPILWEPDMPEPAWLQELDPNRPTVYVTMGSTGHGRFFEYAAEIFGDTEYQVVMTTGNMKVDLPRIPKNFWVVPYAPGLAILKRSHVTINHSGNGSVYQALKAGVPIVGIPTHVDQEMNVQRIQDLGVGVRLRESTLTPMQLKQAVEKVISDPSYRENARVIAERIDTYNGPATSARLIDEFVHEKVAASHRPEESFETAVRKELLLTR